jgi:hypothetical protein
MRPARPIALLALLRRAIWLAAPASGRARSAPGAGVNRLQLGLLALLLVCAAPAPGSDDRAGWRSETVIAGDYFGAGSALEPGAAVDGDAFIAGGQVAIRVPVGGDALLSGGSVSVAERIGGDLYAGGGSVTVDSTVAHNARVAGGRVHLTRRGRIDGKATLAGGRVEVDGAVARQLTVFGGTVSIDGEVGGDVTVAARELILGPGARIAGRLAYRGPAPATVHPQAVIGGGIQYRLFAFGRDRVEPIARAAAWIGAMAFSAGLFLVGLLAILLLPQASSRGAGCVRSRPFASLGLGFALVVCIPVAAVLIMATLIGIPLAFALLFTYPVLLMFGYLNGVMSISDAIAGLLSRMRPPGRALRIGLLALALAGMLLLANIPVAGWLPGLVLMFAGTGGLVLALFGARGGR